jgi:hypothetical protein
LLVTFGVNSIVRRGVLLALVGVLAWSCDGSDDLVVGRLIVASPGGGSGGVVTPGGGAGGGSPGTSMDAGPGDAAAGGSAGVGSPTSSLQPCGAGTTPCPADEFCSFAGVAACGENGLGQCVQRPNTDCPTTCTTPMLCACNGLRYCNECFAQAAGFDVAPDAVCQYRHCGSWLGVACADSEFCDYPDLSCGSEKVGNCLVRPTNCPVACDPTCACDSLEYCNECFAHIAGVDRSDNLLCQ